jgi:DNA-binding FadR family transcriptional regulator
VPLEIIEPRRLYRLIADQVRHLMDEGEYPPGSRLPAERELADRLGVSRPTVREALIALEVEGRLRIRVGSGIYVTRQHPAAAAAGSPTMEGPLEVLGARALIESAIAEEAARLAQHKDVVRIDRVLAGMQRLRRGGEAFLTLDRRFHTAIATTMGNGVLVRLVGELFDLRINAYVGRRPVHTRTAQSWRAAHAEHRAIRDAIAVRDGVAAGAAMREHLQRSQQRFARDFGEAATRGGRNGNGTQNSTPRTNQTAKQRTRPQKIRLGVPQRRMAYGKGAKSAVK